ncbi:hypothetical protein B0H34DRAFT_708456 [Crassisporium funariophilum]|nr:hypothetical protein B0H34DRAFT_708456 [Crassisporium funariophilum]
MHHRHRVCLTAAWVAPPYLAPSDALPATHWQAVRLPTPTLRVAFMGDRPGVSGGIVANGDWLMGFWLSRLGLVRVRDAIG